MQLLEDALRLLFDIVVLLVSRRIDARLGLERCRNVDCFQSFVRFVLSHCLEARKESEGWIRGEGRDGP